jgi:hypothetical protein
MNLTPLDASNMIYFANFWMGASMTTPAWLLPAAAAALLTMTTLAMATPLGSNILLNGNAETGTGSASGNDVVSIPGWTTTSNFTVVQYGAPGGFPDNSVSSSIGGGINFFAGGPNTTFSSATQTVSILDLATLIDAGGASATLSGDLGGFDGQSDNMTVTATFLGAASNSLGSVIIGPVTETERAGVSTLLFDTGSVAIPVGTQSIMVEMDATRVDGAYDDGYADNISLVLNGSGPTTTVPEPASLSLLTAALAMLGFKRWRDQA